MVRTHTLSTAFSIVIGILLALALTLLAGYLAGVTTDRPAPKVAAVPEGVSPGQEVQPLPQKETMLQWVPSEPVEPFYVRAQGARGPLVVYEMASGQEHFRLPPGMPSADWAYYYATTLQHDETLLQVFKPQTGQLERDFSLSGQWSLSGVSPTGRWLALTRLPAEAEKEVWRKEGRWQTDLQIFDSANGQVSHTVQFDGNFEVETISTRGDSLFLIEHLPAVNPTNYLVRLYDLTAARLQPEALRAKTATEQVMTGLAWGGVASPNGRWLLTLYLNTPHDLAFIHTLNLEDKFPFCINLPSGQGDLEQLKAYSLAFSPDRQTVYAANAALGVVAEVSLSELRVIRQTEFPAAAPPASAEAGLQTGPTNYSVVSKDGKMLYFTSGWDVWSYNTSTGEVKGPYWQGASIGGLALSRDEQQLYLAVKGQAPLIVELEDQVALHPSSTIIDEEALDDQAGVLHH